MVQTSPYHIEKLVIKESQFYNSKIGIIAIIIIVPRITMRGDDAQIIIYKTFTWIPL